MSQTGKTIENSVTHDRVIFRATAQGTNGSLRKGWIQKIA